MIPTPSMRPAQSPSPEWAISEGLTPYPEALAVMEARVAAIRAGTADLLAPRSPVSQAGRGGQWTYHGPGQRTAYVMLDLGRRGRDVRAYVHALEEWLIRALDRFGVRGERREGRVGIWVADRARGTEDKVAAIGVRVTRWVTWHGVALNVDPDLGHFGGIVPCGVSEHGVTSLHRLGVLATVEEADAALRAAWGEVFGEAIARRARPGGEA